MLHPEFKKDWWNLHDELRELLRSEMDARNKLTHGYDEIENVQVWNILINHLPTLKIEVENLLNEN